MDPHPPAEAAGAVPSGVGAVARRIRGLGGVPWRRLFSYLRPELPAFSIAIAGLVIGSGLSLLVPLVIAGLVGTVVAGGDPAVLDRLIVGLVVLFLVQSLGGFVQGYLLGVVGERMVARLRGELFERLVTLSLDFHSRSRVGELVSAALERRDAHPDDAHPDDDVAAVVADRPRGRRRHPVPAQPDAAGRGAACWRRP